MEAQQLLLLLFLFIKHYIADFLLQTDWIVTQKAKNPFVLAFHCFEHSIATAIVLFFFTNFSTLLIICVAECVVHFGIDYIKASPRFLGKYKPPTTAFFNLLGLDQLLHSITYLGIAWYLI